MIIHVNRIDFWEVRTSAKNGVRSWKLISFDPLLNCIIIIFGQFSGFCLFSYLILFRQRPRTILCEVLQSVTRAAFDSLILKDKSIPRENKHTFKQTKQNTNKTKFQSISNVTATTVFVSARKINHYDFWFWSFVVLQRCRIMALSFHNSSSSPGFIFPSYSIFSIFLFYCKIVVAWRPNCDLIMHPNTNKSEILQINIMHPNINKIEWIPIKFNYKHTVIWWNEKRKIINIV